MQCTPRPVRTPVPDSSESLGSTDFNPEINIDFEEDCPFREGVISETYHRPDMSFFQEPHELESLVNTGNLVQKCLPKQADIDKILKIIQKKVLKGTHLPVMMKEIQAGYLAYISKKDCNSKGGNAIRKYILLDSLLFKLLPPKRMKQHC